MTTAQIGASAPSDTLLAEAAYLRSRPTFDAGVRAYAVGLVRFRQSGALANKLSAHKTRLRAVGYLLHLSATDALEGGDGFVSYGDLYELCVEHRREVGPRVLKTVLALMRFAGFVERRRSSTDRRVTHYRPTPRLRAFTMTWFKHPAETLDIMLPGPDRTRLLQEDEVFLSRVLASGGRDHADGPPAELMSDFISYLGGMEGAAGILAALMLAEIDGEPMASRAGLARDFYLSKSQVNRIVTEGTRRGYLVLDDVGLPAMTPALRNDFRQWISIEMAFYARHMR